MTEYIGSLVSEELITPATTALRLVLALILGLCIGAERQVRRHDAGLRTFTLICLGSACAVVISIWIPQTHPDLLNGDPGRIAAQVLAGVGFIGAGAIVKSKGGVQGLTSAACIWQTSIVGMTAGAGLYLGATVMMLMTLFVLVTMERVERFFRIDGENFVLTLVLSTITPDIAAIEASIREAGGKLKESSMSADMTHGTSTVTFRLTLSSTVRQAEIVKALARHSEVTSVNLVD